MPSNIVSIYLDESGNLSFDFTKKKTTKYFVITALLCNDSKTSQQINRIIKWTNKYQNNQIKIKFPEVKGSSSTLKIKQYFYKHIRKLNSWGLYTIIVDKKKWSTKQKATISSDEFYDEILIKLLKVITYKGPTNITIDLSKNKKGRHNLNTKIFNTFPKEQLNIKHDSSHHQSQIQAADLFCWGIAKKYEANNTEWYQIFKDKIIKEVLT